MRVTQAAEPVLRPARRRGRVKLLGYSTDGTVSTVALYRPETRNAFCIADWQDLKALAWRAGSDGTKVLILRSDMRGTFSAGSDLHELRALLDEPDRHSLFAAEMGGAIEALAQLPIPVLAVIDGDCVGAGAALALACDIRIGGKHARIGFTPAKLGISFPQRDVLRLVQLVGPAQARRLLFSASLVARDEALRLGLVEVIDDEPEACAIQLARLCWENDGPAIARLKAVVASCGSTPALDDIAFLESLGSSDAAGRIDLFLRRRSLVTGVAEGHPGGPGLAGS